MVLGRGGEGAAERERGVIKEKRYTDEDNNTRTKVEEERDRGVRDRGRED